MRDRLATECGDKTLFPDHVDVHRPHFKLTATVRKRLLQHHYQEQGRRCANRYCDRTDFALMELEHKVPFSVSHDNSLQNTHAVCRPCNGRKGARTWRAFLQEEGARAGAAEGRERAGLF